MSRRSPLLLPVSLLLVLAGATAASAAPTPTSGVHFTRNSTPSCTVTDTGATATATCNSEVAGLGEGDVLVETTLAGVTVYQCQNQGGNTAPGQNKVLTGPETTPSIIKGDEAKNGRLRIPGSGSLTSEPTVSGAEAGCPNPNWTGVNPDLSITSITYAASQGGEAIFTCTRTGTALTGTITFTDAECDGAARF